ncbi:AraC family transcriptional regulator [Pseudomonas aeruginosa]|nr:AraC family transcriptional regulator [Pseudomonas aeruginosa]MCS9303590.1 AraC family transcriptional regulator [Pseudomonas aeruginosa]MCS9324810.1 AraC family transcriptional regulator [Pseudomonas aeruginosa]
MPSDPLSRTLELVDARTLYAGGFIGGGAWSVRFPPPRKIKFFVIGRGSCLLALDGTPTPFQLAEGDIFLLTRNAGFTVASDLALDPRSSDELFANMASVIIPVGQGDDFLFLGGHIDTAQAGGRLMSEGLPDFLHLPASESGTSRLGGLIRELVEEAAGQAPGAEMACSSLAHLLLIQILRRHLSTDDLQAPGWLRVACDSRLAPALALMHGDLAHPWSLAELARAAAMSRTSFATHFRAVAGLPPLAYLTEWRMRHAERQLRRKGSSVARIAESVGYNSEAAFGTAFKRVMGYSPRHPARTSARDAGEHGAA